MRTFLIFSCLLSSLLCSPAFSLENRKLFGDLDYLTSIDRLISGSRIDCSIKYWTATVCDDHARFAGHPFHQIFSGDDNRRLIGTVLTSEYSDEVFLDAAREISRRLAAIAIYCRENGVMKDLMQERAKYSSVKAFNAYLETKLKEIALKKCGVIVWYGFPANEMGKTVSDSFKHNQGLHQTAEMVISKGQKPGTTEINIQFRYI